MGKSVQDVMTRDPRTATPSLTLTEAAQMMKSENAGSLPVVEDGRLVGIVTDRDIVVRAVAEGVDPRVLTVGDIASRPVVALTPSQDLDEALAMMAQYQVRRLPVVEWDDVVVGILAQADVALNVKEKQAGETLEEISRPPRRPGSDSRGAIAHRRRPAAPADGCGCSRAVPGADASRLSRPDGGEVVLSTSDGARDSATMPTSSNTPVLPLEGHYDARGVLRRDVRGARPAAAALPRAGRAARGAERRGVRAAPARGRRLVPQPGHRLHGLRRGAGARADLPVRPDPARDPAGRVGAHRARADPARARAQPLPRRRLPRPADPARRADPGRARVRRDATSAAR